MKWAGRLSSPVVQALRWLVSEGAIDGEPAEIYGASVGPPNYG